MASYSDYLKQTGQAPPAAENMPSRGAMLAAMAGPATPRYQPGIGLEQAVAPYVPPDPNLEATTDANLATGYPSLMPDGGVTGGDEELSYVVPKPFAKKKYGGIFDQHFAVRDAAATGFGAEPDPALDPFGQPIAPEPAPYLDAAGNTAPPVGGMSQTPQYVQADQIQTPIDREMAEKFPRATRMLQMTQRSRAARDMKLMKEARPPQPVPPGLAKAQKG